MVKVLWFWMYLLILIYLVTCLLRDVIVSLDGVPIRNVHDWIKMTALFNRLDLQDINASEYVQIYNRMGYCIPNFTLEESNKNHLVEKQQSDCPDDLAAFLPIPCSHSAVLSSGESQTIKTNQIYCLNAKDVIKFDKCLMVGWQLPPMIAVAFVHRVSPIQMPGFIWVEFTYSSPYSTQCVQVGRKSVSDSKDYGIKESNCGGTFVFIGDVISMTSSIQLTTYQPRWTLNFGTNLPNVSERILMCTFHISLTLAFLNNLPVYLLDGKTILEAVLCNFKSLHSGSRGRILKVWLFF